MGALGRIAALQDTDRLRSGCWPRGEPSVFMEDEKSVRHAVDEFEFVNFNLHLSLLFGSEPSSCQRGQLQDDPEGFCISSRSACR